MRTNWKTGIAALAKAATVAALTVGITVVAQPAQKASAQVLTGAGGVSITPLSGYAWEGGNGKQVTYVNSNRHINELYVRIGGSWQYADLTQLAGGPPVFGAISGYAWEGGNGKQVAYVSRNGHINELYVSRGGSWQHADLTQLSRNSLR